jgi:hypothetical protein
VLRCGVLRCGVLCCGVLRCGVLCCAVLVWQRGSQIPLRCIQRHSLLLAAAAEPAAAGSRTTWCLARLVARAMPKAA